MEIMKGSYPSNMSSLAAQTLTRDVRVWAVRLQHALWDGGLPYYGKFLVPICVTDLMKLTPLCPYPLNSKTNFLQK